MPSDSDLYIDLPHLSAGARIDLVRLVDYCKRRHLDSLGADNDRINAKKQYLDLYREKSINMSETQISERFENECRGGLEDIIRTFFAPNTLPLTAQIVTNEVINKLIKTKIFTISSNNFSLPFPVNSLEFNREKGEKFLEGKVNTTDPIPEKFWETPNSNSN